MSREKLPTYTDPEWVEYLLESVEKRVSALQDRAMKHTVLVEMLEVLTPEELVDFLSLLCSRSADGQQRTRELHQELALEPSALSLLPYEHIKKSYSIASLRNEDSVMGMFMGEPLRGSPTVDECFTGNDHIELSLGQRRAAARSADRFVLDRLLHDRNVLVISLLLDNPKIVERDVVKIAALRPTRPEILQRISKHRRWASRYHVRKALTSNPYTPHQVARRLMSTLMMQDVRLLYNMGALPPALRAEAQRLLQERDRIHQNAEGKVEDVLEEKEPVEDDLVSIAEEWLAQLDIEEEDSHIVETTKVGEEDDEDDLEALLAQAEEELLNSVLVEVDEDPSFE